MTAITSFWFNLDCRIYRIFALAWMCFIFYISHQSSISVPSVISIPGQDKIFHFFVYAILGFFVAGSFSSFVKGISIREALWVFLIVFLYAVSDEFHQSFIPGRDPSAGDVLADCLGGIFAIWLARWRSRSKVKI